MTMMTSAIVLLLVSTQLQKSPEVTSERELIHVEEVTDLDGEIGEGGFDSRVVGGRWFTSKLRFCGDEVRSAGRSWASRHNFAVIKEEVSDNRILLQMSGDKLGGMFELLYRHSTAPDTASVKFRFFKIDGGTVLPELSFPALGIEALSQQLKKALECSGA